MLQSRKALSALTAILLLMMIPFPSAANGTTWVETYGGTGYDQATAVVECAGGGYAIAGSSEHVPSGYWRMWLVRLDDQREQVWDQFYGTTTAASICEDMLEVSTGGFILVGRDHQHDMWVVRTDAFGEMTWNKTFYEGPAAGGGHAYSVFECTNGDFVIAGYGGGEAVLLRIDSNGNQHWNLTCSNKGDSFDNVNLDSVIENSAGELMAIGYIETYDVDYTSDLWMIVTDANGNILTNMTLDNHNTDRGYSILEVTTGGYVVAGTTSDAWKDIGWLVYFDAELNVPWTMTFDPGEYYDFNTLFDVVECSDGGFALCGRTSHHDYGDNVWLVRTDNQGNQTWWKDHGDTGSRRP